MTNTSELAIEEYIQRVLVVDDLRAFHITLNGILKNIGFAKVDYAETAEQAFSYLKEFKYGLILCDYNLGGNRKNGRQILEELRERNLIPATCLFIIISGENDRAMVLGALENQPDDYVMKPFSLMQLKSRLKRAFRKRISLLPVYQPMQAKQYQAAVDACLEQIQQGSRYANYCRHLLSELYGKVGDFDKARQLLEAILDERDMVWAKVALGKVYLGLNRIDDAINLLEAVIKRHPLLIEAYDCLASCLQKKGEHASALDIIESATNISPYAISRQQALADLAIQNKQWETAKRAFAAVYELSKRSVYNSPEHMLNYIRMAFDAAVSVDDPQLAKRYEAEAMNALFRARQDNLYPDFDFASFEGLCQAKNQARRGEHVRAKKTFYTAAASYMTDTDICLPDDFVPEALAILSDIGEFEQAITYCKRLNAMDELGYYANRVLSEFEQEGDAQTRLQQFTSYNRQGITYFGEQNFKAALESFRLALDVAPTNTGAALNTIQALLYLNNEQKKPDGGLLAECKKCFRLLDGVPLPASQRKRYRDLKQMYQTATGGRG